MATHEARAKLERQLICQVYGSDPGSLHEEVAPDDFICPMSATIWATIQHLDFHDVVAYDKAVYEALNDAGVGPLDGNTHNWRVMVNYRYRWSGSVDVESLAAVVARNGQVWRLRQQLTQAISDLDRGDDSAAMMHANLAD